MSGSSPNDPIYVHDSSDSESDYSEDYDAPNLSDVSDDESTPTVPEEPSVDVADKDKDEDVLDEEYQVRFGIYVRVLFADIDNNGRRDILVKPSGFADWYIHLNTPQSSADCDGNGVPNECEPGSCGNESPGDVDGDGIVNATDLALLLAAWDSADLTADLTGDGTVDAADLSVLLAHWTMG